MKEAIQHIRPSALREIAVTVPNVPIFPNDNKQVHWSDIGGLEEVKKKMIELIEWPMLYADKLQYFQITPPKGVLLYQFFLLIHLQIWSSWLFKDIISKSNCNRS